MNFQHSMYLKVQNICHQLSASLVGRDQELRLVLLAALTRHHSLMIGPPGTAKSLIARTVFKAIATPENDPHAWFQVLLMRFSKPDEIFGPLDIDRLKAGFYKRRTERFLPKATFGFLDETFKASSAILNSLLTILNERKFYNDNDDPQVPLWSLVGASNELPRPGFADTASDALLALYDRFLVRFWLQNVPEEHFSELLDMYCRATTPGELTDRLTLHEVKTAHEESKNVLVPFPIRLLIEELRRKLTVYADTVASQIDKAEQDQDATKMRIPFYVSDRRWGSILEILKVSAWYDNRHYVSLIDLQLLRFLIPCHEDDIQPIQERLVDIAPILSPAVKEQVLASIATANTAKTSSEIETGIRQLDALHSIIHQALGLADVSDELKSHSWLTQATLDSITNGKPMASLKDPEESRTEFEAVLVQIQDALQSLRDRKPSEDEGKIESDSEEAESNDASKLEIAKLHLSLSLLQPLNSGGLGTDGWPGETPSKSVYISDSPIQWRTWNEVMSSADGKNGLLAAIPGSLNRVETFIARLQSRLDTTEVACGQYKVRLMTLNEWRLAMWLSADQRPFTAFLNDQQFQSRVQCTDGLNSSATMLPKSETLRHCRSPELYSLIGGQRQLCFNAEYSLVGGASHYTYEQCVKTIHATEEAIGQRVADACFRVVLEPVK